MKRSAGVWLGGAALAIAAGWGASMVGQPAAIDTSVQLPASADPVNPQAILRDQVEALIAAASGANDVSQLPGFESVAMLAARPELAWMPPRLAEADVAPALALRLARKLPRRQGGPAAVATILEPVLASGDEAAIDDAIGVLRTRGELNAKHDPRCGCSSGVFRGRWLLVWSARTGVGTTKEGQEYHAVAVGGGPRAVAVRLAD